MNKIFTTKPVLKAKGRQGKFQIGIVFFFLFAANYGFTQSTDPLSYHTAKQLSDTSFSVKKANGDSTIFLFEGSSPSDSTGYRTMSVNADSSQIIWQGLNQPSDTLEVWGNGTNSGDSVGYRTMSVNADSSQLIWQGLNQPTDTLEIWGTGTDSASGLSNYYIKSEIDGFLNNKQDKLILTTTGSGAATLNGSTLNIPTNTSAVAGWSLTGNSGTTSSNFIGTTDNTPLYFKLNNTNAGRIATDKTAFGNNSLPIATTGAYNTAIGDNSLSSNTTGSKNVAVGTGGALAYNTTGIYNTAVGYFASWRNVQGHENTAIGALAMTYDTAGTGNTAIGTGALNTQTSNYRNAGDFNTALGWDALQGDQTTYYNIALGYIAGRNTSNNNTLFISDSAYHMHYNIDSVIGTPPSVIGKDPNGNWHSYQSPGKVTIKSTDPTTADIPDGFTGVYKNSTTGNVYLWANVGGTLFKTQLQ